MESSTFPSPSRNFYSRPCGRGDFVGLQLVNVDHFISTHAPAGGATFAFSEEWDGLTKFLLTPLREGRPIAGRFFVNHASFLLTPLREGRPVCKPRKTRQGKISTHAPAGGATLPLQRRLRCLQQFLLTPLREGRRTTPEALDPYTPFLLTPLREGRRPR